MHVSHVEGCCSARALTKFGPCPLNEEHVKEGRLLLRRVIEAEGPSVKVFIAITTEKQSGWAQVLHLEGFKYVDSVFGNPLHHNPEIKLVVWTRGHI